MCFDKKYFFCFSLEKGCLILGFITFSPQVIGMLASFSVNELALPFNVAMLLAFWALCLLFLSMVMVATSIAFLVVRHACPDCRYLTSLSEKALDILLPTIIVLGTLWMGFSVLLCVGIWKSVPSFVLSFFSFSTMLTIVLQLGALLLLLESCWVISLVLFLLSIVHVYSIVMVHTAYDIMQIRRGFYERQKSESEAILVNEEE